MSIESLEAENKELRFALDKEIEERNKIGLMYEELLKEKAELEKQSELDADKIDKLTAEIDYMLPFQRFFF